MITDLCSLCRLWHAPAADCKQADADGRAWLVKPPIDPIPEPVVVDERTPPHVKRKYVRRTACA